MSNNSQSLNSVTPSDDFQIDTPEKRLLLQSLAQKLFHRVCEINLNTDHCINFSASSNRYSNASLNFDLYWYVNGDYEKHGKPVTEHGECYSWLSSEEIERWFRDAHIGLDLLVAENKAA